MTKRTTQDQSFAIGEHPSPHVITLHNTEGGSDKIYRIILTQSDEGFTVHYANGRRGGTLATGTKTAVPVKWPEARKIVNKLLAEKIGKGYVPIADTMMGEPGTESAMAVRPSDSGIRPQLLNPIAPEELDGLLKDDAYIAQPKYDGERRLVRSQGGTVTGINRKGQTVALPPVIADAIAGLNLELLIDGEQIGDRLYIFDLLEQEGTDLRGTPLGARLAKLLNLASFAKLPVSDDAPLCLAETAWGITKKRALLTRITQEDGEGIVFKRIDSPYTSGRPNSGGPQLKHKLYDSLSAIVAGLNAQRSVALDLVDDCGRRIPVGNVSIPVNHPVPAMGAVVEVRYLYAYNGGALYQPVFEGLRTDIAPSECLASQRKFKPAA